MTIGRRLAAACLFALATAACGGSTEEADCVEGWQEAEQTISVREAVDDAPDEIVSVEGALVFRDLETRLCATLLAGGRCGEPSLRVATIGNPMRAIEGLTVDQTRPPVAWTESVSFDGVVEDGALSVPLTCGSERVIEHFADETGQRLYRDLYGSGSDADHLNFEAAPNPETAAARRDEWGTFGILVMVDSPQAALQWSLEQLGPYIVELPTRQPDSQGVVWAQVEEAGWVALKPYGREHLLQWWAGERETDDRWGRLDKLLAELA